MRFGKVQSAARGFNEATQSVSRAAGKATVSLKSVTAHTFKFASSLGRIVKYRFLRSLLRSITQGLQEGLENVYNYSNAMSGEAHRMADALDGFTTANQTMKNQIGSAWGELLSIIIPVINAIINAVTAAVDKISQLFAALGGNSSYYKAVNASAKFAQNTAAGAKAAKELRRQLMGFDEINRLDAPTDASGGGGGGTNNNAGKMFDYTPIAENIKIVAQKIKENLPLIEAAFGGFELALGAILFFTGAAPVIGLGLMIDGVRRLAKTVNMDWSYVDKNLSQKIADIMAIVGLGLFALGVIFLFVGHPVIGIGMMLAGGAAMYSANLIWGKINNDVASQMTSLLGLGALLLGAVGVILLFTGHPMLGIGMLIAAGALGVTAVAINWDYILEHAKKSWNNIKTWWNTNVKKYFTWAYWDNLFQTSVVAGFEQMGKDLESIIQPLINWIDKLFQPRSMPLNVDLWTGGSLMGGGMYNIPMFASGGFPEDGLFMANHNELIGQFGNGNTAVANNQEIIAGIERGVYNAMTSAMASNNGGDRSIRVYLDGKEIGAATRKYERNINRATGVALG